MNSFLKILFIAGAVLLLTTGNSFAYTIQDTYIGADPTGDTSWEDNDIIGEEHLFGISEMAVGIGGGTMTVDIYSNYFDNIGALQTQLGDLFISTDGYHPVIPTQDDYFYNGEVWEYALVMDNHTGTSSGTAYLMPISYSSLDPRVSGDILLSYAPSGYIYREGQEVQYNGSDFSNALLAGSWLNAGDRLSFSIAVGDWMGSGPLGFHWTMTCANDVIEGEVPVPEPATMLLVGAGLVTLAGLGRRKFGKNRRNG